MLIETASASLLVSVLRKGKLKNFQNVYINKWYLIIISGGLQVLLKMGFMQNLFYLVIILSYLLILLCLAFNLKMLFFAFIGTLLNFIVIATNNGLMPVSIKSLEFAGYDVSTLTGTHFDALHSIITDSTYLPFLADIIPIPEPYPFPQILSIGDLFIMVGVFIFIQKSVRGSNVEFRG